MQVPKAVAVAHDSVDLPSLKLQPPQQQPQPRSRHVMLKVSLPPALAAVTLTERLELPAEFFDGHEAGDPQPRAAGGRLTAQEEQAGKEGKEVLSVGAAMRRTLHKALDKGILTPPEPEAADAGGDARRNFVERICSRHVLVQVAAQRQKLLGFGADIHLPLAQHLDPTLMDSSAVTPVIKLHMMRADLFHLGQPNRPGRTPGSSKGPDQDGLPEAPRAVAPTTGLLDTRLPVIMGLLLVQLPRSKSPPESAFTVLTVDGVACWRSQEHFAQFRVQPLKKQSQPVLFVARPSIVGVSVHQDQEASLSNRWVIHVVDDPAARREDIITFQAHAAQMAELWISSMRALATGSPGQLALMQRSSSHRNLSKPAQQPLAAADGSQEALAAQPDNPVEEIRRLRQFLKLRNQELSMMGGEVERLKAQMEQLTAQIADERREWSARVHFLELDLEKMAAVHEAQLGVTIEGIAGVRADPPGGSPVIRRRRMRERAHRLREWLEGQAVQQQMAGHVLDDEDAETPVSRAGDGFTVADSLGGGRGWVEPKSGGTIAYGSAGRPAMPASLFHQPQQQQPQSPSTPSSRLRSPGVSRGSAGDDPAHFQAQRRFLMMDSDTVRYDPSYNDSDSDLSKSSLSAASFGEGRHPPDVGATGTLRLPR